MVAGVGNVSCTSKNHHYRRAVSCQTSKDQAFKFDVQLLAIAGVYSIDMNSSTRIRLLAGVFLILFGFWLWNWIAGWGLVTVRAYGETFADIERSIERQGGIQIVSNVPPETKLSMEVIKVSPAEAVNVLAARVDGRWAVTYIAAPDRAAVKAGIIALQAAGGDETFRLIRVRGWGGDMFDAAPDVRRVRWSVSPMEDSSLQAYLDQLVQKTGVSVMVPTEWNPPIAKTPKNNDAAGAVNALVSAAGGKVDEVFTIIIRPEGSGGGDDRDWNEDRPRGAGTGGAQPGDNSAAAGGNREASAPSGDRSASADWGRERVMAQIEQLPAVEREKVKAEYDEMRKFFEGLRQLPEDQRRAAMEERMNDPVVQERMMERELNRDMNRGPERRIARYRRYIERKENYRNEQSQ